VAGVFNFPTDYAGPQVEIPLDQTTPANLYGIWNGADEMTIDYFQRYSEGEIVVRSPIFLEACVAKTPAPVITAAATRSLSTSPISATLCGSRVQAGAGGARISPTLGDAP